MKKQWLIVLTLLVTFGSLLWKAMPVTAAHGTNMTLRLVQTEFSAPPHAPALGDIYTFSEDAYDQAGHKVGRVGSHCIIHSLLRGAPELLCSGSLKLDGRGQVIIEGLFSLDQTHFTSALVGGDGEFKDSQGQATFDILSPTETMMAIELDD